MSARTPPSLALLAALALAACSETVAFLPLELEVPAWEPAITCPNDPRRVKEVVIRVECPGATLEERFSTSEGAVSLSEVPLGECLITVTGINAYGRVLLSGSASAEVAVGDNPAVKISLREQKCAGQCDADDDGLADSDEKSIGTSSANSDHDGDGLYDGLELQTCCTDPLKPTPQTATNSCKLVIQEVTPPLAPPGDWVLIKTSKQLTAPKVVLGGAPLDAPLSDSFTLFGRVSPRAVLGEIALTTAAKETATYKNLFAVLLKDPEMWFDLDQKAGAKVGLMQEAVDMAHVGTLLVTLGRSGPVGNSRIPVLHFLNRATGTQTRLPITTQSPPVAVDYVTSRLGVLLRTGTNTASVLGYQLDPKTGKITGGTAKAISAPGVVDMKLDSSGGSALVLSRAQLTGVPLSGSSQPNAVVVSVQPGSAAPGSVPPVRTTCTGLAYHEPSGVKPGEGTAFMACSGQKQPCSVGNCPSWAAMLALGPVTSCLAKAAAGGTKAMTGCWTVYTATQAQTTLGAPLVDPQASKVYLLTNRGVYAGAFPGKVATVAVRPMQPVLAYQHQGKTAGLRVMTQDALGRLYVADGPAVRRLDVRTAAAPSGKVPHRSFLAGWAKEEAALLSVSGDGSLLEVSRQRGGALHSLAGVCLRRCATCLCK